MRCKICRVKIKQKYFLQKTCENEECIKEYNKQNPKTRINQVSKKRSKQNSEYLKEREKFLALPENKICPVTGKPAIEIHHVNGRENERLNDKKYWLAVSREGHLWIHMNPKEARDKGWLI